MNEPGKHEVITATKLVVRVLQDVVSRDRFATYSDLADALKTRCRKLKIPYDSTLVSDAIDRLEMGGKTRIVAPAAPTEAPSHAAETDTRDCSRSEAASLYRELIARLTPQPVARPVIAGAPEHFPSLVQVRS